MSIGDNSLAGLKLLVERIERLEDDKSSIAEDIRDVYAEAKANGYDVKALRTLIRRRGMDAEKRAEQDAMLELYEQRLADLLK